MRCKKGTFDLETCKGNCPEDCEHGAWNGGICGAECLNCGGDLYLNEYDKVVCTDCSAEQNSI